MVAHSKHPSNKVKVKSVSKHDLKYTHQGLGQFHFDSSQFRKKPNSKLLSLKALKSIGISVCFLNCLDLELTPTLILILVSR
ncbi:hypothetical protein J4Q44_G00159580 [Coregonus suidteri]|uniref:Uncharacterized protein n=1 Tax=Coregonus suidteri TaxID=861788 RepID=A0AAN8LR16_9TELE